MYHGLAVYRAIGDGQYEQVCEPNPMIAFLMGPSYPGEILGSGQWDQTGWHWEKHGFEYTQVNTGPVGTGGYFMAFTSMNNAHGPVVIANLP